MIAPWIAICKYSVWINDIVDAVSVNINSMVAGSASCGDSVWSDYVIVAASVNLYTIVDGASAVGGDCIWGDCVITGGVEKENAVAVASAVGGDGIITKSVVVSVGVQVNALVFGECAADRDNIWSERIRIYIRSEINAIITIYTFDWNIIRDEYIVFAIIIKQNAIIVATTVSSDDVGSDIIKVWNRI